LIDRVGGDGDNFIGTNLSDIASEEIADGEAPFEGYFKPHNPLSVFSGIDPNGKWILDIYDGAADNTGMLHAWGLKLFFDQATDMKDEVTSIPQNFTLSHNYPNPFNPTTKIKFTIPSVETGKLVPPWRDAPSLRCKLAVYDLLGRKVATLLNEERRPGEYEIEFNGSDLASGVYLYRLRAGDFTATRKMILIR
jgi:hypothetical protein